MGEHMDDHIETCAGDEVDIMRALENATYETRKNQLKREIPYVKNYLETLETELRELELEKNF